MQSPPKRLSAGIVIVRETPAGLCYLLLRAYRHWDFPKGMVEAGETPFEAARREVREETGLTELEFPWGEAHADTPPYSHGKVARYFLARAPDGDVTLAANPTTGIHEHMEYRWMDYGEAAGRVVPRIKTILDWAVKYMNSG